MLYALVREGIIIKTEEMEQSITLAPNKGVWLPVYENYPLVKPEWYDRSVLITENSVNYIWTSKDVEGIRQSIVPDVKAQAFILLQKTDWYIVRKYETGTDVPENVTTYRSAIREHCDDVISEINNKTFEQLLTYDWQANWPVLTV